MEHTQGEWSQITGLEKPYDRCIHSEGKLICRLPIITHADSTKKELEANAKLIAAAPELLEALKEMNAWVAVNFPEHGMKHEFGTCASFNQMRAAIKKATE